jgi:hypothetical protein
VARGPRKIEIRIDVSALSSTHTDERFGDRLYEPPNAAQAYQLPALYLEGNVLCAGDLEEWTDFAAFELAAATARALDRRY